MAVSNLPIFPQALVDFSVSIVPATTTNTVSLVVGGTNGTKIESIIATSNNITDLALNLWVNTGGSDTLLASILVAANSGNNSSPAIPTVNVLGNGQTPGLATDPNGNKYMLIATGTTLKVSANTAVGAGKTLNIFASGGNY